MARCLVANSSHEDDDTALLAGRQSNDHLDDSIDRLQNFLQKLGFIQKSFFCSLYSWVVFLVVAIVLPSIVMRLSLCKSCEAFEIEGLEFEILLFDSITASISLICVSSNLRKRRLRTLLFLQSLDGNPNLVDEYAEKINDFPRVVLLCLVPFLLLKIAREVGRVILTRDSPWWEETAKSIILVISWTYTSAIYLCGCVCFSLVCYLQKIRFENYGKLLESDMDVGVYIEEHMRMTQDLTKTSHRFRQFLIFEFIVVSLVQVVALFQTTTPGKYNSIVSSGNYAISCLMEVVGLLICLHAAAKITHRAQGVTSVATRWHSMVTCGTSLGGRVHVSTSESDLEGGDSFVPVPTATQFSLQTTSYYKRQALVMYLLTNPGGITIYGLPMDRMLINTIFFIELSLVLYVLGNTTFSSG